MRNQKLDRYRLSMAPMINIIWPYLKTRIKTAAINLKGALQAMGDSQSAVESSGDDTKKKALQDLIGPVSSNGLKMHFAATNIQTL